MINERGSFPFRARQRSIGEIDPHALKIPARRAESTLTENARSPISAEPEKSEYILEVSDEGVGLPASIDPSTSTTMGLRLVSLLTEVRHD